MSSPIDKQFGSLYIFGKYDDGFVDVNWGGHQDTVLTHVSEKEADFITKIWDELLEETERLYYLQLSNKPTKLDFQDDDKTLKVFVRDLPQTKGGK